MTNPRCGVAAVAALTLAVLTAAPARSEVIGIIGLSGLQAEILAAATSGTPYTFTGTCTDCSGVATATLRLKGYTPGAALTLANLVSFAYAPTNLFSGLGLYGPDFPLLIASGSGAGMLTGSLPAGLPGAADITITGAGFTFTTSLADGRWSIGPTIADTDHGTEGTWSVAAIPEPGSVSLLIMAVGGIAGLARRRRAD